MTDTIVKNLLRKENIFLKYVTVCHRKQTNKTYYI